MMTTRELAEILLSYPEGTEVAVPGKQDDGQGILVEPSVIRFDGKVVVL